MKSLRFESLMVSLAISLVFVFAAGTAFAQQQYEVKPRILVVFDTSGSMAFDFSGNHTGGDGSVDDWDGSNQCCPGTAFGGGETSRLYAAKNAMAQMLNASGEIEFALLKFSQFYSTAQPAFPSTIYQAGYYENNQINGENDILRYSGGYYNPSWEWISPDFSDPTEYLAVGFGDYASTGDDLLYGRSVNTENDRAEVMMWLDHHEYEAGTQTPEGSLYAGPAGDYTEQELRGDGGTPLEDALNASYDYLQLLRNTATGLDDYRSCRRYTVIVLTDGAADAGQNPAAAVTQIRNLANWPGHNVPIDVWVIGLAFASDTLDLMATNGGMHFDPNNWGSAFTAYSESALASALFYIVNDSLVFEECNYVDDDCDFIVDEGVGGQFCDAHNTYLSSATMVSWDTDSDPYWTESGDTETYSNPNHNYVCDDPGETFCDGIDDNCNGEIDEAPVDGAWDTDEDSEFGAACTPPDDTDVPAYLSSNPDAIPAPCRAGTWVCKTGGEGKQCVNYVGPNPEICDGIDNDCDGLTDEADGDTDYTIVDTDATCGSSVGACQAGYLECTPSGWVCNNVEGSVEVCDGTDNDCDGSVDETFAGQGDDCYEDTDSDVGNGCVWGGSSWSCYGTCALGETICSADTDGVYGTSCVGMSTPKLDNTCNGIDDDCDNVIDDDVPPGTAACPAGSSTWTVKDTDNPYTQCVAGTLQCCGSGVSGCTMPDDAGITVCVPDGGELAIVAPSTEICDGYDNDCDGTVDEGLSTSCGGCVDTDFDCIDTDPGAGECSVGVITCTAANGSGAESWSTCQGGQGPVAETCNGKDDDCDGVVDEPGDLNLGSCYPIGLTGCSDTDCIGECARGTYECNNGTIICTGYTAPTLEGTVCDNLDNNCNGQIDEGILDVCADAIDTDQFPGAQYGVGICRYGVRYCSEDTDGDPAAWGECTGDQGPTAELCNGRDDDCDGLYEDEEALDLAANSADSLVGTTCGACDGIYECVADTSKTVGQLGAYGLECNGDEPGVEVCNDSDENCNDIADDGIDPVACGGCLVGVDTDFDCIDTDPGAGECSQGLNYCLSGAMTVDCYGSVGPVAEVCDGLDNDCDGQIDEDFIGGPDVICQIAVGECPQGIEQCIAVDGVVALHCCDANVWESDSDCVTPEVAQNEVCDGRDNDCDGSVDEELPGAGDPCGESLGICEPGTRQCMMDTDLGDYGLVCIGGSGGTTEECNNLDDDCDGFVDEDIPPGNVCTKAPGWMSDSSLQATYPEGIGVCPLGNEECVAGDWICDVPGPTPEVCDGLDNDCDGLVDEEEEVECPLEGSICIEGECAELCGDGEFTCPVGKECVAQLNGVQLCMSSLCDATRNDALPCVFNDYYCTPDQGFEPPCACDPLAQMCVDVCFSKTCPDGQVCVAEDNGRCHDETEGCMVVGCDTDEICVPIDVCNTEPCQECVTDPCASVTCADNQYCNSDGECVGTCENVECPSNQGCQDGECVDDACAGVQCVAGVLCNPETGACDASLDNPCKGVSCEFYEVCVDGECEFDLCTNVVCPNGLECFEGSCYTPDAGGSGTTDADTDADADFDSDTSDDTESDNGNDTDSSGTGTTPTSDAPDNYKGLDRVIATGSGGCMCSTAPGAEPVNWLSWTLVFLGAFIYLLRRYAAKRKEVAVKMVSRISVLVLALLVMSCQVKPYEFDGADNEDSSSDSNNNGSDPDGSDSSNSSDDDSSGDTTSDNDTDTDSSTELGQDCSECDTNETCCTNANGVQFCVDLLVTPAHCGVCNNECIIDHATAACEEGSCVIAACQTYWSDVNGSLADGCESFCQPTVDPNDNGDICDGLASSADPDSDNYIPLDNDCDFEFDEDVDFQNDTKNCGYCGNLCLFEHAAAQCVAGVCTMGNCNERWWNLTGGDDDGCEYYCDGDTDAAEVCDNRDNNCNGSVDEGNPGGGGECYPAGSAGCDLDTDGTYNCAGICNAGVLNCTNGNLTCDGEQLPEDEVCDGLDNNCNGLIDEGLRISCGGAPGADPGLGVCQQGLAACSAVSPAEGVPGTAVYDTDAGCVGDVSPGTERCDNLDNDCDGLVDELAAEDSDNNNISISDAERLGLACGFGVCAQYVTQCIDGRITCEDFTVPDVEIACDDLDNDCDGSVDEVASYQCGGSNGVICNDTDNGCDEFSEGICQVGMYSCADSDGCINDVGPQCGDTDHCDACDGMDNDCDGIVDEDAFSGLSDLGCGSACKEGTLTCTGGSVECVIPDTDLAASPDLCDPANKDEDCDASTPNGYGEPNFGQPCDGADDDACEEGTWTCGTSGMECTNESISYTEVCDGIDNDCDDLVDELDPNLIWADTDPATFGCDACPGTTRVVCDGANGWRCQYDADSEGEVDCLDADCFTHASSEDAVWGCDGFDNDCDGQADDDFNFLNDEDNCNGCGNSCAVEFGDTDATPGISTYACSQGACVITDCDGVYRDANSNPSDGCECTYNAAACDTDGQCDKCWSGSVQDEDDDCDGIVDEDKNAFEKCNGIDDDCNGFVDLADPALDTDDGAGVCNAACGGTKYVSCVPDTDYTDEDWLCVYDTNVVELDSDGVPVADESRCDGFDNDCDGLVDESLGMANADMLGDVCSNDDGSEWAHGICVQDGTWACQADDVFANVICCSSAVNGTCETANIIDTPENLAMGKVELLDGLDNDCDGIVDEGAVDLVDAITIKYPDPVAGPLQFEIFAYEASRQDASYADPGNISSVACSQPDVLPWTYVNFAEAQAACQLLNTETCGDDTDSSGCWDLCSVQQWVYACDAQGIGGADPYYPYGAPYEPYTCNGADYGLLDTDSDTMGVAVRPTATMEACIADWIDTDTADVLLDMSGNVEEWTATATVTGTGDALYDIRGGSYNDLASGLACNFDFTSASGSVTQYRLGNLGFRCCRMSKHCTDDSQCMENFWCNAGTCVEANTNDHCGDRTTVCGAYERCAGSVKGCENCSSHTYCGTTCTSCDTDELCELIRDTDNNYAFVSSSCVIPDTDTSTDTN